VGPRTGEEQEILRNSERLSSPAMDIQLIDEPCYLNLKPETSNIFFKLME
jgi:hypothetical protein